MTQNEKSSVTRHPTFKILFIHHGVGIGGAPLSLLFLIQQLEPSRYHPKALFLYEGAAAELYKKKGVDIRVLNTRWINFAHSEVFWMKWYQPQMMAYTSISWIATAFFLGQRILREEKPDLVHLNSTPLSAWAFAARSLGIPVVCHVREPIHPGYCGIRRFLFRKILQRTVDRFVAISQHDARRLGLMDKTKVIYNFVDFTLFDRNVEPASLPGKNPQSKVVLYLGGYARIKGISVLAEALQFLDPNIIVLFAGQYHQTKGFGKDPRHWLKNLRSYLGKLKASRVYSRLERSGIAYIIGTRIDVPQWIAASDVVVFPSIVPHFARPLIEAGAMAKPVIASRLDGMEELVVDGVTGLLVPPGDARALATAINRICADSNLARTMGEAGYRRARELFDAVKNAAATFEVYEELLSAD